MPELICVDNDNHKSGAPDTGINILSNPKYSYLGFPKKSFFTYDDGQGNSYIASLWVNNGDNYEINNCLKKNLEVTQNHYELYKKQVDINVAGNHGLDKDLPPFVIQNIDNLKVAFAHGHLGLLWSKEKGEAYVNNNKPGCGLFKYGFAVLLHKFRKHRTYKVKDDVLERLRNFFSEHKPDVLILGHCHTNEVIHDFIYVDGSTYEYFLMPQGRHWFFINNLEINYIRSDRG